MKKNSFLTFCFAFIPGAGEIYLGMMKKGLAVMLLFWSLSMVAGVLFPPLLFLLPVIWCYSFLTPSTSPKSPGRSVRAWIRNLQRALENFSQAAT